MARLVDLTYPVTRKTKAESAIPLVVRSAITINRVPLDRLVTLATLVDLTDRADPSLISRADAASTGVADIGGCILRTGWRDEVAGAAGAQPPVLAVDAAAYLLEGGVRTVAADCPLAGAAADLMLANDCVLVYCVGNLSAIRKRIVRLVALPLKLEDTRSADARVIAIEE